MNHICSKNEDHSQKQNCQYIFLSQDYSEDKGKYCKNPSRNMWRKCTILSWTLIFFKRKKNKSLCSLFGNKNVWLGFAQSVVTQQTWSKVEIWLLLQEGNCMYSFLHNILGTRISLLKPETTWMKKNFGRFCIRPGVAILIT